MGFAGGPAARNGDERALALALADLMRSLVGYQYVQARILNTGNRVGDLP